jgi:hypothetical protein
MSTNAAAVYATSRGTANMDVRVVASLPTRRVLLASTALLLVARAAGAAAETLTGGTGMPWRPFAGQPPAEVKPGPWTFFTPEEGAAVEAWWTG